MQMETWTDQWHGSACWDCWDVRCCATSCNIIRVKRVGCSRLCWNRVNGNFELLRKMRRSLYPSRGPLVDTCGLGLATFPFCALIPGDEARRALGRGFEARLWWLRLAPRYCTRPETRRSPIFSQVGSAGSCHETIWDVSHKCLAQALQSELSPHGVKTGRLPRFWAGGSWCFPSFSIKPWQTSLNPNGCRILSKILPVLWGE